MNPMRLVVGIFTSHEAGRRRDRCRETWFPELLVEGDVEAVFVCGGHGGSRAADPWRREGDTVYVACPDDYESLPQRLRLFLQYALAEHDPEHVFKCDDDTYVCAQRLVELDLTGIDYLGHDHGPRVRCPAYAHGGAGYVLSRRAAQILAQNIPARAEGDEDLTAGIILAQHGVALTHDERFVPSWDPRRAPRPDNETITLHYVNDDERMSLVREAWR